MTNSGPDNSNTSSADTQREIRIQKIQRLRDHGLDPFVVGSKRDFSLAFVQFWFDFVHKFDFEEFEKTNDEYIDLYYFLEEVLNPPSLLEVAENKLWNRQNEFEEEDEIDINKEFLDQTRLLFPHITKYTPDQKQDLILEFLGREEEEEYRENFDPVIHKSQTLSVCGRIKSTRISGKIAFVLLEDASLEEGFQIVIKKDQIEKIENPEITDLLNAFDISKLEQLI